MSARALVAGAALAGASVTLFGCGGGGGGGGGYSCTKSVTVKEAWDNHFGAFGDFDLDRIMCDYDDSSFIAVLNDKCGGLKGSTTRSGYSEHKGKEAIRAFFDGLFTQLGKSGDNLDKVGPLADGPSVISENGAGGNVFLTWRTKNLKGANIIDYATDSFSWRQVDGQSLILKQNIITTEPNKDCPEGGDASATNGTESIYDAWGNHFGAFAAGVGNYTEGWQDDMKKEYDDKSIVQVFDTRTEKYTKYTGWGEIEGMFSGLFKEIDDAKTSRTDDALADAGIAVLLQEVNWEYSDVFLAWEANSHVKATDTFVFNTDGTKIVRQNIVVRTKDAGLFAKVLV